MYGYLETIRMLVLHPELKVDGLLTNLMLRTADFVADQPFDLRIVILSYYFRGESWTAATSKIGATNSADYVTKVCDACAQWDKNHVLI